MAIELDKQALAATPDNHARKGSILLSLAKFLHLQFDRNDYDKSFEESLEYLIDGAEVSHSPPTLRIKSPTLAGIMLATKDDWREASRIAELAVNLLPTVAPRQLSQHDQQHLLSTTSVIATMAASFALEAEKAPLHAVQLLELGRGIITSLRSRLWSDVTELSECHPQIAERFE
ncbi:hypothetical protein FOZG_15753 [Fusarium oxysporum Fo47]|uniref:Uncharacterized protein n=1 Tax=Fusarium oxysporum Fo47 TaxID=660027 RepID=W9JLH0_FUSOX|nr:hypothetical protein FOZG_15753 [Fusarium oxysporum Fo47]